MKKWTKRFIINVTWAILLLYGNPCIAEGNDPSHDKSLKWKETSRSALELTQTINDKAAFLEKYINADEHTLRARIKVLKDDLNKNTKELDRLRKELDARQALIERLEIKFQEASSDMKTLEGTVRTTARQCLEQLRLSPVTAMHDKRLQPLKVFLAGKSFPSIQDISVIGQVLFEEIEQTGTVTYSQSDFIGPSGTEITGTIIRCGGFFLGYSDDKNAGFLKSADPIPMVHRGLPASFSKKIKSWLTGDNETLCMDITRGAALEVWEKQRNFHEWFEAGGSLLWPILTIAVGGLFVILYKSCYLFSRRKLSKNIFDRIEQYLNGHDREKCEEIFLKLKHTPAAVVLGNGIRFYNTSLDALDNSLQEAKLNVLARLERMLPLLGVFAAMAPLLGLLGTVTGMIATFQTITIFGTGDPRMLSTGISEALITTQAGLGITIPFMLIHHLLRRRVDTLMNDVDEASAGLAALVAEHQNKQK